MERRIDIVISERGSRVVKRNLQDIALHARQGASGIDEINRAVRNISSSAGVNTLNSAVSGVTTNSRLATRQVRSLSDASATASQQLRLAGQAASGLDSRGAQRVSQGVDSIARSSDVAKDKLRQVGQQSQRTTATVNLLRRALAGIGVALSAQAFVRFLDTSQALENRLTSTGLAGQQLTEVYERLLNVANDTRSSFQGSVELYSRLAVSAKDLGTSQEELVDFTQSLNQAIILSGANAQEANAGLIQLSQGMASGTLRGDELRSVLEQLPAVADVIAKSMGKTRGQLRELGAEGKISAQDILVAFQGAREELNDRFAATVPTIAQSLQVLKNNTVELAKSLNQSTGIGQSLSRVFLSLAENLSVVSRSAIAAASGLVLIGGSQRVIAATTGAVRALTVAIAANPFGALAIAITSAITALTLFRDDIKLGIDETTTLGDLMRAFGETVVSAFQQAANAANSLFGPLFDLVGGFTTQFEFSLTGILRATASAVDNYIGLWSGGISAVKALFVALPGAIADLFTQALNVMLSKISEFVNAAGSLLSNITELAGLGTISSIDLTLDNGFENRAAQLGSQVGDAWREGVESTAGLVGGVLERTFERAQTIGTERLASRPDPIADVGGGGSAATSVAGVTETVPATEQLQGSNFILEERQRILAATIGVQGEFATQLQAINELVAENVLTQGEANNFLVQQNSDLLAGTIEQQQAWVQQQADTYLQIDELRQADLISEQTASQLKLKADAELTAKRLTNATSFFSNLATLSGSGNKKLAVIGKAAAVTQATIDGVVAVQRALASAAPPVNYALAAGVGVTSAANVASIASQPLPGFAFGGDFTVGGMGGTDSQTVAFRATPGETVSVRTPTQNGEAGNVGANTTAASPVSITVVNLPSEDMLEEYLESSESDQVFVNKLTRNADQVRQLASG